MVCTTNSLVSVTSALGWIFFLCGMHDYLCLNKDVATLTSFLQSTCGITPEEKQLSVSAKNWGEVDLNGNMLTFLVGSRQAFEVSLADVSQTQIQGKNDVILESHVDDTTGANEKDSLMEISFHIPNSNTQFVGDENRLAQSSLTKSCQWRVLVQAVKNLLFHLKELRFLLQGEYCTSVWGRYNVELHLSFLRLQGQANDFKIQYSSVVRLFLLPKGLIHEVFILIMRGLSGAKVTRPGRFRSCQDGYAVKSSLKAEDGVLYPLEKGFFFLLKPPTLILHEEIDYVEFERHAAGGSNMHCFDLLIRSKTEQEHLFRNILRNEYHNLFDFISDDDDAVDPHLERIKNAVGEDESDEEDEDFVADRDDGGSPTDDSGEEESDASDSGGEKEKPAKKESKREPSTSKAASSRGKSKDGDEDGLKKRKQKRRRIRMHQRGPYLVLCFSHRAKGSDVGPKLILSRLENIKKINPGIAFTDVGRVLGDKWKKMTAEEKEPYEAKTQADKKRYKDEISGYKNPEPMNIDSGNESDSA
ncbi:hypothetical protein ACSBR1_004619 [Camellia fascicularis]